MNVRNALRRLSAGPWSHFGRGVACWSFLSMAILFNAWCILGVLAVLWAQFEAAKEAR